MISVFLRCSAHSGKTGLELTGIRQELQDKEKALIFHSVKYTFLPGRLSLRFSETQGGSEDFSPFRPAKN